MVSPMKHRFLAAAAASALAVPLVAFASCSSSNETPAPVDAGDQDVDERIIPPTPAEWDRAVTRPDDVTAKTKRDGCTFARGAMPAETLGTSVLVDKDIPIETIVVVIQENHSFDNYFG